MKKLRTLWLRKGVRGFLAGSGLFLTLATPAICAPNSSVWNSVAVCDPNSPSHCLAPDASGNISITGSGVPVGSTNWDTSQITVAATATLLVAARAGRQGVAVTNLGTTAMYCGSTSGVTTANGTLIPGVLGATKTIPAVTAVYCIVAAGTQAVSVEEFY